MVVFKRRQIISFTLITMIVIAGYLQSINKNKSIKTSNDDRDKVYVSASRSVKRKEDFFAKTKLERDIERGQNKEILQEISLDKNATDEVKKSAYEQMMKLTANNEKENKIETMVREIGFNNVIAILGEDESLDIIVKAPKLTSNLATKIANVGKKYANVSFDKIRVKNKK